jgi:hypothetical protein
VTALQSAHLWKLSDCLGKEALIVYVAPQSRKVYDSSLDVVELNNAVITAILVPRLDAVTLNRHRKWR